MRRWAHAIRRLTRHYPFLHGANLASRLAHALLAGAEPLWVETRAGAGGPALALDLRDHLQRKMFFFPRPYLGREYLRSPLARLIDLRLRPGDVYLDVGANVGVYALLAAARVAPGGQVLAFEPEPGAFQALSRSARANRFDHLRVLPLALSDRAGTRDLLRARHGTAHSLRPEPPARAARYRDRVPVETATLDELAATLLADPRRVRLVKIDVEGEEAHALAGMIGTLRGAGAPPIWCEVRGPRGSTRAPDTFARVRDLLAPLGYASFRWNGASRPVGPEDVSGREDVLFARGPID